MRSKFCIEIKIKESSKNPINKRPRNKNKKNDFDSIHQSSNISTKLFIGYNFVILSNIDINNTNINYFENISNENNNIIEILSDKKLFDLLNNQVKKILIDSINNKKKTETGAYTYAKIKFDLKNINNNNI